MSNKEKCLSLLNGFDEEQLGNIAMILQAAKRAIDEASEEAYCSSLYREYQSDPDKGETISLEDAAKQLGVSLE